MLIGAVVALVSYFLKTSVESFDPGGLYSVARTTSVVNLGLLQAQTLTFASGAVLFLSGAIFTAAGVIAEKLGAPVALVSDDISKPNPIEGQMIQAEDDHDATIASPTEHPAEGYTSVLLIIGGLVLVFVFVVVFVSLGSRSDVGADSKAAIDAAVNSAEANAAMYENMADALGGR